MQDNLAIDFDPMNLTDSVIYVCLGKKHLYNPNMTVEPILREHDISPAYRVNIGSGCYLLNNNTIYSSPFTNAWRLR